MTFLLDFGFELRPPDPRKSLFGVDIEFGSDFDGLGNSLPKGLKDVSMYPNIIEKLLKKNFSEKDIKKICSENLFRVWNANLQNHQT